RRAVQIVLGRGSAWRRAAVSPAGHTGIGRRVVDRVIYLWGVVGWILPRYALVASHPARRHHGHGSRDRGDEFRRFRQADDPDLSPHDRPSDYAVAHRFSLVRSDRHHVYSGSGSAFIVDACLTGP